MTTSDIPPEFITIKITQKTSQSHEVRERHEKLARPGELFVADARSTNLTSVWGIEQSDLFRWMADAELKGHAPNDVQDVYDIARNLFLYSWYQYRFSIVTAQQAISAIEMALRSRFEIEGISIKGRRGTDKTLRPLFADAVHRGWITDEGFGPWLPASIQNPISSGNSYSDTLKDILPRIRNWLAHGTSSFLDQGEMKDFIGRSGSIIDQLFP